MCDNKEIIANNKYKDFKIETDDKFEEMDSEGHEHEFSSNILSELIMNTLDSVREHYPFIVLMVSDNIELCKGMICKDK